MMHRLPSRLAATLTLCLTSSAWAGVPVTLPETQDPSDWEASFALAGLEPGLPGNAAFAVVHQADQRWTVVVRDEAGGTHTVTIPQPDTEASREDFAWLVASLVIPVSAPAPSPPPPPPTPQVIARPARAAPVAAAPPPVEPPPTVEPPALAPPPPPPPPPPRPRVSWAIAPTLRLGTNAAPSPGVELGGVLDSTGLLHFAVFVEPDLPSALYDQPHERTVWQLNTRASAGVVLPWFEALALDSTLGGSIRSFNVGHDQTQSILIPFVGAEASIRLPISDRLNVGPFARLDLDMRRTDLIEGSTSLSSLAPLGVRLGFRVEPQTRESQ